MSSPSRPDKADSYVLVNSPRFVWNLKLCIEVFFVKKIFPFHSNFNSTRESEWLVNPDIAEQNTREHKIVHVSVVRRSRIIVTIFERFVSLANLALVCGGIAFRDAWVCGHEFTLFSHRGPSATGGQRSLCFPLGQPSDETPRKTFAEAPRRARLLLRAILEVGSRAVRIIERSKTPLPGRLGSVPTGEHSNLQTARRGWLEIQILFCYACSRGKRFRAVYLLLLLHSGNTCEWLWNRVEKTISSICSFFLFDLWSNYQLFLKIVFSLWLFISNAET